jgi:hypothetical protein
MSRRRLTSTPAVGSSRNRICGSCDSALAISRRRFMPPDKVMIGLSRLSHSDRSRSTFRCTPDSALAEQAAAEGHRAAHRFEGVGGEFLRHQSDQRARGAVVGDDVVPADADLPSLAVTMPQTMLISVVLPAPLGPSRAKISPRRMSRLMRLSAWKPEA